MGGPHGRYAAREPARPGRVPRRPGHPVHPPVQLYEVCVRADLVPSAGRTGVCVAERDGRIVVIHPDQRGLPYRRGCGDRSGCLLTQRYEFR